MGLYLNNTASIDSVLEQINAQKARTKDFLMNTSTLREPEVGEDGTLSLKTEVGRMDFDKHAEQQLAQFVGVPFPYLSRIKTQLPELYHDTLTKMLRERDGTPRMVRTIDGNARAFLSDSFARLDNDLLASSLLKIADKGLEVKGFNIDEQGMSMHIINPKLEGEVRKGDVVRYGFHIRNSEVGKHALESLAVAFRLVCTNGMVRPEDLFKFRRVHSGASNLKSMSRQERVPEYTVHDIEQGFHALAENATNDKALNNYIADMKELDAIEVDKPDEVLERVQKKYSLSNMQVDSITNHYERDGLPTRWGFVNAITRTAQDQEINAEARRLEEVGGLLTREKSIW